MKKQILVILMVLVISLMFVVPIEAGTDVVNFATPIFTGGIINFNINYVTDTRLDLNWEFNPLAPSVTNIMIRAKYGSYPTDIPDSTTAPSDGYLVYYGSGTSVSDTSMNFDQNPGTINYKAWGQNSDGSWETVTNKGAKESKNMTLIALLFAPIALAGVGAGLKNGVFCWLAIPFWLGFGAYAGANYSWFGDAQFAVCMLIAFGASVGMAFEVASFRPKKETADGGEVEVDTEQEERLANVKAITSRFEKFNATMDAYSNAMGRRKPRL